MSYEHKTNNHNMLWYRVKKIMKTQNISQSELARRANINKTVVSSLKNGKIRKPSFDLVCKLADALDVSLEEFRDVNQTEVKEKNDHTRTFTLKEFIQEKMKKYGYKHYHMANLLDMSVVTWSNRLTLKSKFKPWEIEFLEDLFYLEDGELERLIIKEKEQANETQNN